MIHTLERLQELDFYILKIIVVVGCENKVIRVNQNNSDCRVSPDARGVPVIPFSVGALIRFELGEAELLEFFMQTICP